MEGAVPYIRAYAISSRDYPLLASDQDSGNDDCRWQIHVGNEFIEKQHTEPCHESERGHPYLSVCHIRKVISCEVSGLTSSMEACKPCVWH